MRVLVLGASGMAGHIIAAYLGERGFTVTALAGHKKATSKTVVLDLTKKEECESYLQKHSFDVIINCVGVLIEQSENRKDLAAYLNGYLPHFLENTFAKQRTKVIHLSTDCVFSGENGPYTEDSPYDGQTFYDRSKALGEIKNNKDLTLRMSIIGPDVNAEGTGLFNWFFAQTGTIFGFTKVVWNGVTTLELAKGIEAAIDQNLTGLYHFVPSETITKHDLLHLFKDTFDRTDITIRAKAGKVSNKVLVNTRRDFDYQVPDYKTMVADMKQWVETHKSLYKHYIKERG